MSAIKIDKDVPLPTRCGAGKNKKYPFADLEVGESFFVPGKTPEKLSGVVGYWRRMTGWKFTCRTVKGGVRVWRVS